MISSEIARAGGRTNLSRIRGKSNRVKSNPQLLNQNDTLTLSSPYSSSGPGTIVTAKTPSLSAMLPIGSERNQSVSNSGNGGEVTAKTSVTKYANPPAVEVNGQMWAIAH